ncbi:hypothetical protein HG530_004549 [Fusarium avenaceum]|nr:hypothetical protein HG530_004549 [Fusarium avenaceum]
MGPLPDRARASGSDLGQDRANGFHKTVLVMRSGILQSGLNDIVGKGVAKQTLHLLFVKQFVNDQILGRRLGAAQTFLDNVGAELVTGQFGDATLEVAKGVLDKDSCMLSDLRNKPDLLITRCVINAALKNTTAVSMSANLNTALANSVEDELSIGGSKLVEALLNDMVAIEILDQLNNFFTKCLDDEMNLLRGAHELNHLLKRACAVLVERNANHVLGSVLNQSSPLIVIAKLEELLAQIITKRVRHELNDVLVGFVPYHVNLLGVAFFKLLLEVTAAVLVLAKIINCAHEGIKGHVLVARHGC